MMTTATRVESISPISRSECEALARTEYERVAAQLRSLGEAEWSLPTDCELWDVRAMAGHTTGMLSDFTGFRPLMRRMRAATKATKREGGPFIDHMTAMQVADNAQLSVGELIAKVEANGSRAAAWRRKAPALFRRMPMQEEVAGVKETWRMAYLLETILTRDPWMHRLDIARATGRAMDLTGEHDGRIVADVVVEWARRHGQPFHLTLTGPAGGEFVAGVDGEELTLEATDFCRILSGRAEGSGLLAQPVPF